MNYERNKNKRFLGYFFALTLVFTMLLGLGVTASAADKTVLAFTSDVHNGTGNGSSDNNVSGRRLDGWLDSIKAKYGAGNVDVMGFCGDMGPASGSANSFWDYVTYATNVVSDHDAISASNDGKGVYTTGNHEYSPGSFGSVSNSTKNLYKVGAEGRNGSTYRIYCLGTASGSSYSWGYTSDQASALTSYLNSVDNSKPIFVLTHFPLHIYSQGGRTTNNASLIIDALNNAVTKNGQKIVLLWGHNHTVADPHYDQVYLPGAGLKYSSSSDIKGIKFYYAAAGAMADSEYGSSGQVKGKGLIVTIDENKDLDFTYYDKNGTAVAQTINTKGDGTPSDQPSGGDDPEPQTGDTVNITPSTSNPEQSIKIKAGDTFTINVTNGSSSSAYDYTATLSNNSNVEITSTNPVNIKAGEKGKFTVRGLKEGTVDITIQNNQSSSQYVRKAVVHVTVGEGGTTPVDPEPQTGDKVDITPTTDNPERTIRINVGDTFTINTTNGSSNSAYDFTATSGNTSIAQIQGNKTVNIGMGATGQFTVKGIANGTADITIENTNQYGSQYVRKGTIHVIVGEGGTTPVDPDPQTGDTVDITPGRDEVIPEKSIQINVNDTLTINVKNGSENNNDWDYEATLNKTGIAEITSANPVNIKAGETGQIKVKGIAAGKVDISVKNINEDHPEYTREGIIHLTVVDTAPVKYTVQFVDDDDTVISTAEYAKGTAAADITVPEIPTQKVTAEYTYTFKEWTPAIADVTADAVYKATYNATKNKYTVSFVDDEDNPLMDAAEYEYGTKAEAIAVPEPIKAATAEYTYTFKEWTPAIADVTEDVVYKATFDKTKNKYTIRFINDEYHPLQDPAEYEYGTKAENIAKPETPTKEATAEYTYTFKGWDPEIADVTTSATYKATFDAKVNTYDVIWKNGDDSVLETEPNVMYGKKISYTGKVTPTKAEDDKYTYTFEGWDPEIPEDGYVVTGETTFIPKFKAVAKPDVTPDATTQDDKKSDDKKVTPSPNKEAPSAEELAKAPLNTALPVINPEKIKTTGSMSKQTMTIKLGKLNADNCLVEYRQVGAKTWKSQWYGKGASQLVINNMKKNGFYQYRFTTVKLVNGQWTKGKTSNTCYRWIKNIKAKKPVAGKKRFTFKWKKVKSANGYEIQYARNKAFTKSAKKVTVKGAKKTSKTIKGLKKGKTYYVRIRPYKTKGGKKYLGIYTVAKKVKVK